MGAPLSGLPAGGPLCGFVAPPDDDDASPPEDDDAPPPDDDPPPEDDEPPPLEPPSAEVALVLELHPAPVASDSSAIRTAEDLDFILRQ